MNFYPSVAYFIAYNRTRECNPDTIFALLHYLDSDVEVKTVDSRIKGGEEEDIATEKIARELFQVVKDRDNNAVKSLVKDSMVQSLQKCWMGGRKRKYTQHLDELGHDHQHQGDFNFVIQ